MAHKHFQALADALRFSKPTLDASGDSNAETVQWEADVQAIADACYQFNGMFDRGRFYAACDYTPA